MVDILQIVLAAFIAGLLDTVVGFGGGLLLLPILVGLVGTADAVVLTALIPFGWNIPRIPFLRPFLDLRAIMLFALGIVPGAFLGGLFLNKIDVDQLRFAIGLLLIALGLLHILRLYVELPVRNLSERWSFPVVGFLAGALTAILGAGNGPLQSWTMSATGLVPQTIVAVNGVLGVLSGGVRLIAYGLEGMLQNFPWVMAGAGFVSAVIGAIAGIRISRRASDSTLKLIIGIVIVIAGVRLMV
ncbi:MAG: sulfite exporter TauE/SafE family protein [Ignavibacteriae bacterium]|nr:sulfite exporter TauE/SafE family protein [Ignavibacteriota bacterium]MCB9217675.1 sulfite exporter TauE/SafE family protein [Ignavibacteria bacterium]